MLLLLLILLCGCSRRFARLRRSGDVRVQVSMPSRRRTPEPVAAPQGDTTAASGPITFTTEDGRELRLVPAAYDDRLQESVMNLRIEQVTISVNNIRNVAERNGKIDLEFSVTLPRELLDDQWRVELEPVLCTRQDTFSLHRLLFTGERFRRLQRQDMARYDRYLHSIVDSADYFRCFADVAGFESYLHKAAVRRQALLEEKARLDAAAGNTVSGRSRLSDRRVYRRGLRDLRRQAARERRSRLDSVGALGRAAQGHPSDPLAAYLAPHYKPRPVETPGYVRAIRRELSDSSEVQRSRIRRRTVEANIRLLSDLDTAALMLEYYDLRKIERNEERARNKEAVFRRVVRFPELPGTRLDTIVHADRSVTYRYAEQLDAGEHTDRIHLFLRGAVTSVGGRRYELPASDTLTYSVTSMISFIDDAPRYVHRIVRRDAEADARFFFVFPRNGTEVREDLADNRAQLAAVKRLTQALMTDPVFIIDSIALTATSSPEGSWKVNDRLARERSAALKEVLVREFRKMKDSLGIAGSYVLDAGGGVRRIETDNGLPDLPDRVRAGWLAEDWGRLEELVRADSALAADREGILALVRKEVDSDRREWLIRKRFPASYAYMREKLYPQMRAVDFRFSLHRCGMKRDTVWTTVLDSAYLRGVELLKKRRYEEALALLRPYEDRNTALAYMSVGLDRAAARILGREETRRPDDAEVKYMLAVVSARLGDNERAVRSLLRAAELQPRLRFRGNLDPELSALIRRYDLFNDNTVNL